MQSFFNFKVCHPRCVGSITKNFCVLHIQSNTTIFSSTVRIQLHAFLKFGVEVSYKMFSRHVFHENWFGDSKVLLMVMMDFYSYCSYILNNLSKVWSNTSLCNPVLHL